MKMEECGKSYLHALICGIKGCESCSEKNCPRTFEAEEQMVTRLLARNASLETIKKAILEGVDPSIGCKMPIRIVYCKKITTTSIALTL